MNIFEQASRENLRFSTSVGNISVEDLWDLPLTSVKGLDLHKIALDLQTELSKEPAKSLDFFAFAPAKNPTLQLKFDIVKHIVTTRVAENHTKSEQAAKDSQREQIKALIAEKKQEDLKSKSVEELEALLNA